MIQDGGRFGRCYLDEIALLEEQLWSNVRRGGDRSRLDGFFRFVEELLYRIVTVGRRRSGAVFNFDKRMRRNWHRYGRLNGCRCGETVQLHLLAARVERCPLDVCAIVSASIGCQRQVPCAVMSLGVLLLLNRRRKGRNQLQRVLVQAIALAIPRQLVQRGTAGRGQVVRAEHLQWCQRRRLQLLLGLLLRNLRQKQVRRLNRRRLGVRGPQHRLLEWFYTGNKDFI